MTQISMEKLLKVMNNNFTTVNRMFVLKLRLTYRCYFQKVKLVTSTKQIAFIILFCLDINKLKYKNNQPFI